MKETVVRYLQKEQADFKDFGVSSPDPADYPDIGIQVAEAVAGGEFERGILVCATGIGMSITANKIPGVRAASCANTYCAWMSREHNDANVLVLGSRVTNEDTALDIVRTWLSSDFPGVERHVRRIQKISDIEKKYNRGGS